MYGKNGPPAAVVRHAEFTISHPRAGDPETCPKPAPNKAIMVSDDVYVDVPGESERFGRRGVLLHRRGSASNRSTHSDSTPKSYGFQKGNLLFTSTPPRKSFNFTEANTNTNRLGVQDSGYGSDLLSPNSFGSCLPPRRPVQQPYNRKCRSTCNIVLSTNIQDENRTEDAADLFIRNAEELRACDAKLPRYGVTERITFTVAVTPGVTTCTTGMTSPARGGSPRCWRLARIVRADRRPPRRSTRRAANTPEIRCPKRTTRGRTLACRRSR
jgi:hypothetical protein